MVLDTIVSQFRTVYHKKENNIIFKIDLHSSLSFLQGLLSALSALYFFLRACRPSFFKAVAEPREPNGYQIAAGCMASRVYLTTSGQKLLPS
jgi:hypothetical protein